MQILIQWILRESPRFCNVAGTQTIFWVARTQITPKGIHKYVLKRTDRRPKSNLSSCQGSTSSLSKDNQILSQSIWDYGVYTPKSLHHSVSQTLFHQWFQEKTWPCTKDYDSIQLILTFMQHHLGLQVYNWLLPVPNEKEPTTRLARSYLCHYSSSHSLHSS